MLSEGDLVTPSVRLVRLLAEGGMGSVWVADHLALGTQVAVKFMTESHAATAGAMARFTSEATAAARVKSPHIVQVFDHGVAPTGEPFIVMELLDGRDLRDHLQLRDVLPLPEIVDIVAQSCRGLAKAHAAGIVHRDIKPDNLFLLEPDGERFVKILDFGVAKQQVADDVLRMTATGTMVGTPYFMSPEQAIGLKDIDFETDLWSLAVVTYQCVAGSLPFGGDTVGALFVAIDRAEFAPPSILSPGLPPEVDAFFQKALARKPSDRFPSARAFADAFERAVFGNDPTWDDRSSAAARRGSLADWDRGSLPENHGSGVAPAPAPSADGEGGAASPASSKDEDAAAVADEAARSSTFDAHASTGHHERSQAASAARARRRTGLAVVAAVGALAAGILVLALRPRGDDAAGARVGRAADDGVVVARGLVLSATVAASGEVAPAPAPTASGPVLAPVDTAATPTVTPVLSASGQSAVPPVEPKTSTKTSTKTGTKTIAPKTTPVETKPPTTKHVTPTATVDRGFLPTRDEPRTRRREGAVGSGGGGLGIVEQGAGEPRAQVKTTGDRGDPLAILIVGGGAGAAGRSFRANLEPASEVGGDGLDVARADAPHHLVEVALQDRFLRRGGPPKQGLTDPANAVGALDERDPEDAAELLPRPRSRPIGRVGLGDLERADEGGFGGSAPRIDGNRLQFDAEPGKVVDRGAAAGRAERGFEQLTGFALGVQTIARREAGTVLVLVLVLVFVGALVLCRRTAVGTGRWGREALGELVERNAPE
jgi:eukaryotic-like serine/threonine-protein kinase